MRRKRCRLFVPSGSFLVHVRPETGIEPRIRVPGKDGWRGPPEIVCGADTSQREMIRLMAVGELLLRQTRN